MDEIVTKDCNRYANNIQINLKLSCDCSWNHSPVGSVGTVTLYDHNQKKVVASKTLVKENGNFIGNNTGNSNNMESNGHRQILIVTFWDNLKIKNIALFYFS